MREVIAEAPKSERPALEATLPVSRLPSLGPRRSASCSTAAKTPPPTSWPATSLTWSRWCGSTRSGARADRLERPRSSRRGPGHRPHDGTTAAPDARRTAHRGHSRASSAGVDDWGSWLAALYEDPDNPDASQVRRRGAERWTEVLDDDAEVEQLGRADRGASREPAFRDAMPQLVRAVLPSGPDVRGVARRRQRVLSDSPTRSAPSRHQDRPTSTRSLTSPARCWWRGWTAHAYLDLAGQMEQLFGRSPLRHDWRGGSSTSSNCF